jgi:hypothetical protein
MREEIRTQLSQLFSDHASTMDADERRRDSRDREEERVGAEFQARFDAFCRETVVPLFEDVSHEVREGGHGCTVTSTTHGKFFSGPSEAPGVVFMFYPGAETPEGYVLKPFSSHVAVFGDAQKQKVQIHSIAVLPGGFSPGKPPEILPLEEVTDERLGSLCIEIIGETLRRMESGKTRMMPTH